jgi:hypothetical protein
MGDTSSRLGRIITATIRDREFKFTEWLYSGDIRVIEAHMWDVQHQEWRLYGDWDAYPARHGGYSVLSSEGYEAKDITDPFISVIGNIRGKD